MTEYKFGDEVQAGTASYIFKYAGVSKDGFVIVSQTGLAHTVSEIRRPCKLVKARFQPMVIRGFPEADPIMVIEREVDIYCQKWRKVGNIIEIEVDISEQS